MNTSIRSLVGSFASALVVGLTAMAAGAQGSLVINANTSDPAPREAFETMVQKFEAENPDIDVQLTIFEHEAFKPAIRLFLMFDAPDVVTWFPGERMRGFVERGLFEDVSDLWQQDGLTTSMASSLAPLTVDGKQYGVPYTYYQWGVYYRRDLFEQAGVEVPTTWQEFLDVCAKLKETGITPITIGNRILWPAAGWFDYLDLRINGLDFHTELMAGTVPYTDERVRKVFDAWRPLVEQGYFIEDANALTWQEAQQPMIDGKAAMYLIGNFVVPFLEEAGVIEQIGFFPFPVIDPAVAGFEDAPTDTVHIPTGAANKDNARKFLSFIARPENQAEMNQILDQLPPNKDAALPEDRFLAAGFEMLGDAKGTAQFYDRDTTPEMAAIGMLGFQRFLDQPHRLDQILERIEIERRRIFEIYRLPSPEDGDNTTG